MRVDSRLEADSTTIFARASLAARVTRSMYATPLASPVSRSVVTWDTTALVTTEQLPDSSASATVVHGLAKYECVTQPCSHGPQKWHACRPLSGCVRTAARPIVTFLPNLALIWSRKCFSPHVIPMGGCMTLSGNCISPSGSPLMPT